MPALLQKNPLIVLCLLNLNFGLNLMNKEDSFPTYLKKVIKSFSQKFWLIILTIGIGLLTAFVGIITSIYIIGLLGIIVFTVGFILAVKQMFSE